MQDSVQYKGEVLVQLMKGRNIYKTSKLHNSATRDFFLVMCSALVGDGTADRMPRYIRVYTSEGGESIEITRGAVHYSTAEITIPGNNIPKAIFSFVVPSTFIEPGKDIYMVKVFDKEMNGTELASIASATPISTTEEGSNVLITWSMSFYNQEVTNGDN